MSQDEDRSKVLAKLKTDYAITSTPAPLPEGSRGEAWQVVAERGEAGSGLFALTGMATDGFRVGIIDTLRKAPRNVLSPVDWGVIDWPGKQQRIALVFPKLQGITTLGQALLQKRRYSEPEILTQILPRMFGLVKICAEQSIFHGGIRPANLFVGADGELTLNECISAPPSYLQPAWMQPMERGLAAPAGRGNGQVADEIYSMGATLAWLALGQLPACEMSDEEMFQQKIEKGSFGAIVGRLPLSNGLSELIRGMLEDEPSQRWSLEEVEHWIAGRRLSSNQTRTRSKPSRGLMVNGIEYFDPRSLAEAFANHPAEAMKLMVNDELIKWVKRTLKDKALTERIADAANMPIVKGRASPEAFLVARIIIALHPTGPIRYAGLSVLPGGIGGMLQRIIAHGESPQLIAEIIACQLPKYWYNIQTVLAGEHLANMKALEQAKFTLDRAGMGMGIERCLYDLSPDSPLLSHEMPDKVILNVRSVVENLEALSEKADRPSAPLSRHSAAFLMARDGQNAQFFSRFIGAHEPHMLALGALQGLAVLQAKFSIDKLPGLARWLGAAAEPCLLRYHNRETREMLRTELQKAIGLGKLGTIFNLLENPLALHRDRDGFINAVHEYERLEYQAKALHDQLRPGALLHSAAGREAASVVAGVLSTLSVAGIILLQLGGTQ